MWPLICWDMFPPSTVSPQLSSSEMLNFVKWFSHVCWDDHTISVFESVCVINYICWAIPVSLECSLLDDSEWSFFSSWIQLRSNLLSFLHLYSSGRLFCSLGLLTVYMCFWSEGNTSFVEGLRSVLLFLILWINFRIVNVSLVLQSAQLIWNFLSW